MAEIRVRYNGLFRDITGKGEERVDLTELTLEGLVQVLVGFYGKRFTDSLRDDQKKLSPSVTAFVNGKKFPGCQAALADGDGVAFLPFIAGG